MHLQPVDGREVAHRVAEAVVHERIALHRVHADIVVLGLEREDLGIEMCREPRPQGGFGHHRGGCRAGG